MKESLRYSSLRIKTRVKGMSACSIIFINDYELPNNMLKWERILRYILKNGLANVSKISKNTYVSKSYVSEFLKLLRKKGLIIGKNIIYDELITFWGLKKRRFFWNLNMIRISSLFLKKILKHFEKYAISGDLGAFLISGETPGTSAIIYVNEIGREMLKFRSRKGNILIVEYDEDIFRYTMKIRGYNIVFIPQLAADLIMEGIYGGTGLDLLKRWLAYAGRGI